VKLTEASSKTEVVLRLVYRDILPNILSFHIDPRLRLKRPSYETGLTRSHEFMILLAAELGDWWERLVEDNEKSSVSDWNRIERRHMEDAAIELVEIVRAMPAPMREVVERRATGMSWKAICADLPARVYFSIVQDWESGLRLLEMKHFQLLQRFH